MFNRLIFYNHFGNGDVFESREFVRELCKSIPANACIYKHSKGAKALRDMPELAYEYLNTPDPYCDPRKAVQIIDGDYGKDLYVNTWIGRDGKYVLPGIGCTVEKLHLMYNDMLVGLHQLKGQPLDYIPSIDFNYYGDCKQAADFIVRNNYRKYILISNGPAHSSQAVNFSFTPAILKLANKFKDICFFITEGIGEAPTNVVDANKLFWEDNQTNLPEMAYLSTLCELTIGRNSGPHVFSWVKENCFDSEKTTITFTNRIECAHFVYGESIPMKVIWCGLTNEDDVATVLNNYFEATYGGMKGN